MFDVFIFIKNGVYQVFSLLDNIVLIDSINLTMQDFVIGMIAINIIITKIFKLNFDSAETEYINDLHGFDKKSNNKNSYKNYTKKNNNWR